MLWLRIVVSRIFFAVIPNDQDGQLRLIEKQLLQSLKAGRVNLLIKPHVVCCESLAGSYMLLSLVVAPRLSRSSVHTLLRRDSGEFWSQMVAQSWLLSALQHTPVLDTPPWSTPLDIIKQILMDDVLLSSQSASSSPSSSGWFVLLFTSPCHEDDTRPSYEIWNKTKLTLKMFIRMHFLDCFSYLKWMNLNVHVYFYQIIHFSHDIAKIQDSKPPQPSN